MRRAVPPSTASLALSQGLLLRYQDPWGGTVQASPGAVEAVLRSLGANSKDGRQDAARGASASPRVEPVVVLPLKGNGRGQLEIDLPSSCEPSSVNFRLRKEGRSGLGLARPVRVRLRPAPLGGQGRSEKGSKRWVAILSASLQPGVHRLEIEAAGARAGTWLLVPPPRPAPPKGASDRDVGVFVPLYALRSDRDLGVGDLTDLRALVRWASRTGLRFVGTLPLYSTFLDRLFDPSPYRPVSRHFWNEVYLDPTAVPEFVRSREAQKLLASPRSRAELAQLRASDYVDFAAVARLKIQLIELLHRECQREGGRRWTAFQRYLRKRPELKRYAEFRARHEKTPGQRRRLAAFHMFAQWLMEEQLRALSREAERSGVRLYLDLPLGVHPEGWDVEERKDAFVPGVSIGAPPDRNHPTGQSWGLLPHHPQREREQGYSELRETLRRLFAVSKILRIDHVMGLHRLYWVPDGRSPADGVYVAYRPDEAYAIFALEAQRAGAEVVGEDLGTVPPEVRPALRERGFLRMYIAQTEWDGRAHPPAPPAPDSLAALNTHDMPPFARFWADHTAAGHERAVGSGGTDPHSPRKLLPGVPSPPWQDGGAREALMGALRRLARSPARHLLVNLEDLWLEERRQNQPGPSGQGEPNFRRKCRWTVEEIVRSSELRAVLEELIALRRPRGSRSARRSP